MADVAPDGKAEVAADGAYNADRLSRDRQVEIERELTDWGLQGVGCAEHDTAGLDCVESLPHHGDDGTRGHVLDQAREEGLALEIGVI